MKCKFGCGNEAKYQFKSGGWCCSRHWSSCPKVKEKNRKTNKGQKRDEDFKRKRVFNTLGSRNPMYGKKGACAGKYREESFNWKGGGYWYWREELKKVNKECCLCKSKIKLEMHHKDKDTTNNDRCNLIILCMDCHVF